MTLLIAVADSSADGELVASAVNLAKAAGWDARERRSWTWRATHPQS